MSCRKRRRKNEFEEEFEDNGHPSIIKKDERKEIIGDYTPFGYKYEAIIRKRNDSLIKPLIITLPNNKSSDEVPFNYHDIEEMIYVLEGKVDFFYGDEKYPVEAGDCLYFNSTGPHKVVSVAD